MVLVDLEYAGFIVALREIGHREDAEGVSLLVHPLRQAVSRVDQHLQAVVFQKLLDLLVRALPALVVHPLLVASTRPQQVHHRLTVSDLYRPHHIPHLNQTADRPYSRIYAQEAVLDGCSQWQAVEEVVDMGEGRSWVRDVVAQS